MSLAAYIPSPFQIKNAIDKSNKPDVAALQAKTLASIYRAKVIEAYKNRRIFTVFGNYNTIRRALLKRGWIEKLTLNRYTKLQNLPEEILLQHAKRGNEYETVAISKIINHFPAFFVWQPKAQRDLYTDVKPYRNRVRRGHAFDFSTKVGLISCAELAEQWFGQDGVSGMLYPRFFRLSGNEEEQMEFVRDFRLTQCRSLLKYLVKHKDEPELVIDFENGTISPQIVSFAIQQLQCHIDECENIDAPSAEDALMDKDWEDFLNNSHKVINFSNKIKWNYRELMNSVRVAEVILNNIEQKHPGFRWDGFKNLWILKPGYQSRGLGIVLRNNLDDILRWAASHLNRRYIVQKYIEQPLLIYNTKFDIRQYMLIFIRESRVQIWLYRDCYLRFSSQEYSIDDLRESVHLTNNSVQKKYKNKTTRDPRLPKHNMWGLDQFKAYMKSQNIPEDVWENKVFSGFRENLIAVVLASLDETNLCENCFELYGCDFMLDDQYTPILIEINSTPDLSASTEVTARICPMVMEDCIKVVVDLSRNSRASTGHFQKVYEVSYHFKQSEDAIELFNVQGKSVELCPRSRMPCKLKIFRKSKKKETTTKSTSQETQKPLTLLVPTKKSKINIAKNVGNVLKTAAKEALALRYTMPK
ncbi:tubulin glycylase 3B [Musca vetustissima]|uniref:tubulin glycylase 3B n=1 Tax=Musca vetustissima TaxID=27455 RepID=UPI002AB63393|nr:tubulin glycylase 3B [Musca vetustissima]